MALPVAPPPRSNDVAVLGWAGITVRVAWTLLVLGVKVRPDLLREARAHVLFQLDANTPQVFAEDLATHLVEAFVARARGKAPHDPWPQDWEMPVSPRWRRALDRSLDPLAEAVFRKHYGDNRGLARLETSLDADRVSLAAVQSGLREAFRRIASSDGLPIDAWSEERVDRLLRRIAAYAPGPCPPVLDINEGCHPEHVATCARCDRMSRLLRSNAIVIDDLFPPSLGARPTGRAQVLALHFHPDARRALRRVVAELTVPSFSVGDDLLLLDASALDKIEPVLRTATEVDVPSREHLRGAVLEGPGAWTTRGLLGPLPAKAAREVLQRSWGTVDGLDPLPAALPDAPSARGGWAFAFAAAAAAVCAVGLALAPSPTEKTELAVAFDAGRGGLWAAFDTEETTLVTLVAERDGSLSTVSAATSAADKIAWATGDGSYRVHVPGDGVMVVASPRPIADLSGLIARIPRGPDALEQLAATLPEGATARWARR